MKNTLEFIKSLNISDDEPIIVGVSGGADSMFLLCMLKNIGLNPVCAHVNHNVRKESIDEYKYLEEYCKNNNIIFEGTEITEHPSSDFENYARMFRYKFFKSLIDKYNSKYLFTAHHGDDLIETILMRITRGSTLNGYSGFAKVTDKGSYQMIRPLVYMTKDEIENYCIDNNIKYFEDYTNKEDNYTRNRYRHHVLPFLKEESKDVHLKYLSFSESLKDYYDYINRQVYLIIDDIFVDNYLDISKFNNLDEFIKKLVLNEIIRKYYPDDLYFIENTHINEILKVISSDKVNIELFLPKNVKVIKEYDKLYINRDIEDITSYSFEFDNKLSINDITIVKLDEDIEDKSNYVIRLNSEDIKLPLIVRTRQDGDKMEVKNMNGSKKVNDIFIDSKLNKRIRDTYPIVCDSANNILWLPGLKKSKFDIPIGGKYDIILKCLQGGNENEKEN
jgi:tRNA(Ile)-lysidine synthase